MPANDPDCVKGKIDSNIVGLSYAEEKCIGVLPDSSGGSLGDQAGGVWRPLEPNEFDDFGGETTTVARSTINASRQRKKGNVTDLEASGGFTQDMTQTNLQRLMQGFFFADARERPNTAPISDAASALVTLTSVAANTVTLGAGGGLKMKVGDILQLSGMSIPTNNTAGVVVGSIAGDVLTTAGATLTTESATTSSAVAVIGYQFADQEAELVSGAGEKLTLIRFTGSFTTDGFNVGEWIFIGGDVAGTQFDNNAPGYARIEKIEGSSLTLKEPTFTPVSESGQAGKTIEIYLGTYMRNEKDPSLIKRRSYNLERTLGQDTDGVQSEYLVGAVANEFTLNLSTADKMTCDFSFMALNNELRDGDTGVKAGDRNSKLKQEDYFNTSSDVYQLRLFVADPLKATPKSLYSKVMEASLTINNNATGSKAIGVLGAFDVNVGDFEVSGDIEAYFSTVAAVNAVKKNADVGFNVISTKDNSGFVYDIPLLTLGGGKVSVEKDEPIKLPVEQQAAENEMGYTLSATYFNYLPTVAMANVE